MYLFSRRARLSGANLREAAAWAIGVADLATQTSGAPISVWSQVFSPEVGTLVWATFVPDLATLEGINDKLAVDDAYNAEVERGLPYVIPGSVDDGLGIIMNGDPDPNRSIEYVSSVRSTIGGGNLARGMALGVEIAQRAEALSGLPTLFLADATGNYGGVSWITGYTDIAELERAEMAINGDPGFIELLDRNAGVFSDTPGASTQVIARRLSA